MKVYTFEVKIYEGNDHFWDQKPSDKEVTEMFIESLEATGGFEVSNDSGNISNVDVVLKKMELFDE